MKKSILHHLLVAMICSTFAVIATACGSKSTTSGTFSEENSLLTYANHLQLYEEDDDATLCIITDINHPDKRLASYLLLPKGIDNYPSSWKNIEECIVIRTPLDRIALTSTCHAYLLQAIGG